MSQPDGDQRQPEQDYRKLDQRAEDELDSVFHRLSIEMIALS